MKLRTLRLRRAALQLRRAVRPFRAWARLSDITRGARREMAALGQVGRVERFAVYTSDLAGAYERRTYGETLTADTEGDLYEQITGHRPGWETGADLPPI